MSNGVSKSTFIEADERTTKALTYDMLSDLHDKLDELVSCQKTQITVCNGRFAKIEGRKRRDSTLAAGGGALGGFVAIIAYYIKQWLS